MGLRHIAILFLHQAMNVRRTQRARGMKAVKEEPQTGKEVPGTLLGTSNGIRLTRDSRSTLRRPPVKPHLPTAHPSKYQALHRAKLSL